MPCGHDVGTSGRYVEGVVEREVNMVAQEKRDESLEREDVKCVDAVDSVVDAFVAFRRSHVKASMSSRMIEWMRRFILLCFSLSNRWEGRVCSDAIKHSKDCGRKIWTCWSAVLIALIISCF